MRTEKLIPRKSEEPLSRGAAHMTSYKSILTIENIEKTIFSALPKSQYIKYGSRYKIILLFKYIEKFTTKKGKILDKNF